MFAESNEFSYCCGVLEIGNFTDCFVSWRGNDYIEAICNAFKQSKKSYAVATFINTKTCKNAYTELAKHLTIVYQSEPKRNHSDIGNEVFIVIYK